MSADLLNRLAAAGTPMGLIMEVAETLADARAAQRLLDQRRERDRLRKRPYSVEAAESAESVDRVSFDKETTPRPPKKLNPSHVCETREVLGYHRLPEGWQPKMPLPAPLQAKVDQWPPGTFEDEVAAFKRWAANAENKNGKGKKLDWDKALWNWLGRRHDEQYRRNGINANGVGRHQSSDGLSPTTRAAARVFGNAPARQPGAVPG